MNTWDICMMPGLILKVSVHAVTVYSWFGGFGWKKLIVAIVMNCNQMNCDDIRNLLNCNRWNFTYNGAFSTDQDCIFPNYNIGMIGVILKV